MAADPTLTRAAFQAASIKAGADVPNLKPLYDSTLDIMQTGQKFVDSLMNQVQRKNEVERIAKDKQLSGFNKITDDTYSSLYSMDEPMPNKVVNALRTRIKDLKEEFELVNTYGKNDTEENNNARIRLLGELKRITNQTVNTRSKFMEMSGDYPDWNNARINAENIDTLKSFLDLKNMDMNDDISVVYTNEGLTFINAATGKSFTTAQMREAMPIINKAPQTLATSRANDALSLATRNAQNGDNSIYSQDDLNIYNSTKSDVKGAFLDPIKTNEDYVNAATIKLLPKAQTLEKALETYSVIPVEIIKNMYYTEDNNAVPIGETFARLDRDNDGDIDKDDFSGMSQEEFEVFRANHKEMINAIIMPGHPAFNLETSKEILGNYYANIEEQIYTNTYNTVAENKRKKEGKGKTKLSINADTYYRVGQGGRELGSDILLAYNLYDKGQPFNSYDDMFTFTPKKDGTFTVTGPTDPNGDGSFSGPVTTRKVPEAAIVKQMGFDKQAQRLGFEGVKTSLPNVSEENETTNISSVPLPGKEIVFKDISKDTQSQYYIKKLEETYKDYPGFKFKRAPTGAVLITAPDGTEKAISTIGRFNFGREKEARNEIQAFIAKYANTKQ